MACGDPSRRPPRDPAHILWRWTFVSGPDPSQAHTDLGRRRERHWWVTGAVGIALNASMFVMFSHYSSDISPLVYWSGFGIGFCTQALWFVATTRAGGINRAMINAAVRQHDAILRAEAERATAAHLLAHALSEGDLPRVCHCPGLLYGRPATPHALGIGDTP
jgi:hypothetical protein